MKILILGTGAVGAFYGGKLHQSGADVTFIARQDFDFLSRHPMVVDSVDGNFRFQPKLLRFGEKTDLTGQNSPDFLIVCTKVLAKSEILPAVSPYLADKTQIVLIQNGVNVETNWHEVFPNRSIISGLAFICVMRTQAGRVLHTDYGRLVLGLWPKGTFQPANLLVRQFQKAGMQCETTQDVTLARWQKAVWNAAFNPLSVLSGGLTTNALLDDPVYRAEIEAIMQEVCAVATANGNPIAQNVITRMIDSTQYMQPFKTSMLQDRLAGRPLETEAILGEIVRAAEHKSINIPHLMRAYLALKELV